VPEVLETGEILVDGQVVNVIHVGRVTWMDRRPEDATYVEEAVFVTRPKTCAPGTWCGCCLSVDALMLGETETHRRAADDRAACQAT
jgi:hypothetical protein